MLWQPIETAKKEFGTGILAYVEGADGRPLVFVAHWTHPSSMFSSQYVEISPDDPECEWTTSLSRIKQPTHWMPLPPTPKGNHASL